MYEIDVVLSFEAFSVILILFLKYGGNIFSYKDNELQMITLLGFLLKNEIKSTKRSGYILIFFVKENKNTKTNSVLI